MPRKRGLDRRSFLRTAGATALVGATGAQPAAGAASTLLDFSQESQKFDFDQLYDRVGTDSSKWDRPMARFGPGIQAGMGIADQDFRAAPCITRALAERCAHENWGYLTIPDSYVQAIVDWNKRRYDLEIDPDSVELTTGVHAGLIAALRTFAPPGSRVLMATPIYNGFYSDLRRTRTIPDDSPMKLVDGRFEIDFDDFERRARRSSVCIFCNPQNPTGNVWTPEEMTRVGEICLRNRVVVLADEIHCDFVRPGHRYIPFASLPDRDIVDNSLTFKAASKSFSISALKAAWHFSTNPDYLERVRSNTHTELNSLGMVANRAALTEGDAWLDQLIPYIDANHAFAAAYIGDNIPLMHYTEAEGTYLAWLDVSGLAEKIGAEAEAAREWQATGESITPEAVVQRWLAEHAGVYLTTGSGFGAGGAGHMRMNLATPRVVLERALENVAEALARV